MAYILRGGDRYPRAIGSNPYRYEGLSFSFMEPELTMSIKRRLQYLKEHKPRVYEDILSKLGITRTLVDESLLIPESEILEAIGNLLALAISEQHLINRSANISNRGTFRFQNFDALLNHLARVTCSNKNPDATMDTTFFTTTYDGRAVRFIFTPTNQNIQTQYKDKFLEILSLLLYEDDRLVYIGAMIQIKGGGANSYNVDQILSSLGGETPLGVFSIVSETREHNCVSEDLYIGGDSGQSQRFPFLAIPANHLGNFELQDGLGLIFYANLGGYSIADLLKVYNGIHNKKIITQLIFLYLIVQSGTFFWNDGRFEIVKRKVIQNQDQIIRYILNIGENHTYRLTVEEENEIIINVLIMTLLKIFVDAIQMAIKMNISTSSEDDNRLPNNSTIYGHYDFEPQEFTPHLSRPSFERIKEIFQKLVSSQLIYLYNFLNIASSLFDDQEQNTTPGFCIVTLRIKQILNTVINNLNGIENLLSERPIQRIIEQSRHFEIDNDEILEMWGIFQVLARNHFSDYFIET